MNDAASTDGTGGSGGDTHHKLESLAKELHRLVTEKKIAEAHEGGMWAPAFHATTAEAMTDAQAFASGDIETEADGRIKVHRGRSIKYFYPRDSQAWNSVYEPFQTTIDDLVRCGEYDDAGLNMPIIYMDHVIDGLDQGVNLADHAEEIAGASGKELERNLETFFKGEGKWQQTDEVYEALASWEGQAAEMFRLAYVGRLPAILVGQLAVAKVLAITLDSAQKTFKGARRDGEKLAQAAIDAGDGQGAEVDTDFSGELEAAAQVAGLIAAGAAVIPGGQAVSAMAGLVAAGASVGKWLVEQSKDEGTDKDKKPKINLDASSPDELMSQVSRETIQIHGVVSEVQEAAAKWLDNVYEIATSTEKVEVSVTPLYSDDGKSVQLTQRQAFFEPKKPGLATMEDKKGDPSHKDLTDDEVMGSAPDSGSTFAGELKSLWNVGNAWLPGIAGQYEGLTNDTEIAAEGVEAALTPPGSDGGSGQSASTRYGPMAGSWGILHNELLHIFKGSAENLNSVADLLKLAVESYANADTDAKEELRKSYEGKLPWE